MNPFLLLLLFFFVDDAKCDVWSIGVIAYMLLSGTPPFYGKTDAETLQNVRIGRWKFEEALFKPVSSAAKNFVSSCLTKRVSKRLTAKEALNHEWFNRLKYVEKPPQNDDLSADVVHRLHKFVHSTKLVRICMEVVAVIIHCLFSIFTLFIGFMQ